MALTQVSSKGIKNATILDEDVNASAAISGSKIADNSILGNKIPANQITNSHIATTTILRGNMANNSVGNTEIMDEAVTLNKLEHGTSSNNGKFLRANDGADPSFETVPLTVINNNAANKLITGSASSDNLNANANLIYDGTKLEIKAAFGGGGGTGLILNDTVSSGASEGMFIQWQSGTDKQSDQCRIGQVSNSTGNGSNLVFFVNAGDTGASTKRLTIDRKGNLTTGLLNAPATSDDGNIFIKAASTFGSRGLGLQLASNAYYNGSWKAIENGAGCILKMTTDGDFEIFTDNTTTANTDFSLERRFKISEQGRTLIGHDTTVAGNEALTNAKARVQITGPSNISSFSVANSYLHIGGNESQSNPGMLQTISFGHIKTDTNHCPAYIGLKTTDRAAQEKGQIEIATRDVTTDTAPTPSLIIRPNKSIVRRGPDYANYVTSMKTVNGGTSLHDVQVLEDCYGQWLVVAKITSTDEFKGSMSSTGTLDTSNNQVTGDPSWSCLFGDSYPSEIRYISASDWEYWRESRIIDFVHGVPDNRKYRHFFTNGPQSNDSGMGIISDNKHGWKCAGCYDGFGRWRNPFFENHKMADTNAGSNSANNPQITSAFFTTSGQTMNWHNGNLDAKFIASHDDSTDGQDDNWTTGWGWDDNGLIRSDEFPNKGNNSAGTDLADYNLWICIKLSSPTFGHDT